MKGLTSLSPSLLPSLTGHDRRLHSTLSGHHGIEQSQVVEVV